MYMIVMDHYLLYKCIHTHTHIHLDFYTMYMYNVNTSIIEMDKHFHKDKGL